MPITMNWNRIISSLVALIYLFIAYKIAGHEAVFRVVIFVMFPLACIWYADAMGGYIGPRGGASITNTSPGMLVCVLGWVLLVLPVILIWISRIYSK